MLQEHFSLAYFMYFSSDTNMIHLDSKKKLSFQPLEIECFKKRTVYENHKLYCQVSILLHIKSYWKLKASHEQTLIQFPAHNSKIPSSFFMFFYVFLLLQSIIIHIKKSAQIWSELAMKLVHLLIWYLLILSGIHFRFGR